MPDFDSDEFMKMPPEERISLCRLLAEEAVQLASSAEPKHAAGYLDVALQWLQLAEEMERLSDPHAHR